MKKGTFHCVKLTNKLSFKTNLQKVEQHTGDKWLIRGSNTQRQSVANPWSRFGQKHPGRLGILKPNLVWELICTMFSLLLFRYEWSAQEMKLVHVSDNII